MVFLDDYEVALKYVQMDKKWLANDVAKNHLLLQNVNIHRYKMSTIQKKFTNNQIHRSNFRSKLDTYIVREFLEVLFWAGIVRVV